MGSSAPQIGVPSGRGVACIPWLPIALGLIVLYLPTFYDLNRSLWNDEEHAHGPIILLAALWMFWRERAIFVAAASRPATATGTLLLAAGLLCYVIGRSQAVITLETGSLVFVVSGTILLMRGAGAVKRLWFPILFLGFLVPLPGIIVNPLTDVLRSHISFLTEHALYELGYPIARSGAILTVGSYQLLVAEACSGMNSMFSLSALGLVYLYLMQYRNPWRIGMLLASILPIAFAANALRVMVLVLVTYHFGADAGQGFIHGFSGMALFISGLLLLLSVDGLFGTVQARLRKGAA
jgi:exosortase B